MKNKLLLTIAIIALIGFITTACDPGGGNGDPNGPSLGDTITSTTTGMVLTWIPAGTFNMGSNDITYATPQHQVTLTQGFYMGKTEVTQEQWRSVMGNDARLAQVYSETDYGRGDNFPMYWVNWYDIILFCNRLSIADNLTPAYQVSGVSNWATETAPDVNNTNWDSVVIVAGSTGYRLPTEAEWEYACRAGTNTPWNTGISISTSQANIASSVGKTTPVGSYAANPWGLYDIHGNIFEWCWDWYGAYSSGSQNNPNGPVNGNSRVARGGGWMSVNQNARSAYRSNGTQSTRAFDYGFRVARGL